MATKKIANSLLRQAREERGLTQSLLAKKVGVEPQTIRTWERGLRFPSGESILQLCKILEKSPEALGLGLRGSLAVSLPGTTASSELQVTQVVRTISPLPSGERQPIKTIEKNRERMLRRVEVRWITGVLEHSLYKNALILLSLREQAEAIENPWHMFVQETTLPPDAPFPIGTSISEIYDKADGELLILGEPGAGKTTLLLELARELLERAHQNEQHPIPVVFNLSQWAEKQWPLQDWLVEELHTKYQISSQIGQKWIKAEQILPLLDGLDEMEMSARSACIKAINAYRTLHGLVPLVICSRTADYLVQDNRLLLNSAISIEPLTMAQIDTYLGEMGPDLHMLQQSLQSDAELREIASTPLMLNTLIISYQGGQNDDILASGEPQMRRRLVFERFVERLLARRSPKQHYKENQIKVYLGWLAQQMQDRNQTEFYIEQFQPSWLGDDHEQSRYQKSVIRFIAIIQCLVFGGLTAWLKGGLKNGGGGSGNGILGLFGGGTGNSMLGWMAPGIGGGNQGGASLIIILGIVIWLVTTLAGSSILPTITPRAIWHGLWRGGIAFLKTDILTSVLAIPLFSFLGGIQHGLKYGLGIGFFVGISVGLMLGLMAGLCYGQQPPQEKGSFLKRLIDALFFWTSGALGFMLISLLLRVSFQSTVLYSAITGFFFFLTYGFGGGSNLFSSLREPIKPAEIVTWSWTQMAQDMGKNGKKSVIVALVTGLSVGIVIASVSSLFFFDITYGLHYGLVFGTISGLIVGIAAILTSMLKSAWSSDVLPEDRHIHPNEGIIRSGRNALIGSSIFAPIGGIASGAACAVGFGLIGQLPKWTVMGMAFALLLTIVLFTVFTLAHGGIAYIQHYLLRWYLWRAGYIPWSYVRFLNTCATYGLQRKVGGGYMFSHRLVLEYFSHLYRDLP